MPLSTACQSTSIHQRNCWLLQFDQLKIARCPNLQPGIDVVWGTSTMLPLLMSMLPEKQRS